jgi:polyhydroxyalkanoate synthesis regulator phasin
MTTPEPPQTDTEPILGAIRPTTYRLFLAGVGLYAVTRDRLEKFADNWIIRAERLEVERRTRLQQKLGQLPASPSTQAQTAPQTTAEGHNPPPLPLLAELPTQTEIQTLNQRLDNLLTHLDNLPPNA